MSRASWVDLAAKTSFVAPLVAVALVLGLRNLSVSLSSRYFGMGLALFAVSALGFAAAAAAMYLSREGRGSRIRFHAAAGLVGNGALLVAIFGLM